MLIDTHILLWLFEDVPGRMGAKTQAMIKSSLSSCSFSMAGFFEIKVKQRKGGLLGFSIIEMETKSRLAGINIIGIELKHLAEIPGKESVAHSDPFDLILVAQAIAEGIPLLTCDQRILEIVHPNLRLIDGRK